MDIEVFEYPSNEKIVEGLKDYEEFVYVSETYLNAFINYVDIIYACMIQRYRSDKMFERICKLIDNDDKNRFHTDFSKDFFDDIIILSKSGNSYIYFGLIKMFQIVVLEKFLLKNFIMKKKQ